MESNFIKGKKFGNRFLITPRISPKFISTISKIPANCKINTSPYSKPGNGCKRKKRYKKIPTVPLDTASSIIYISELLVCFLKIIRTTCKITINLKNKKNN